MSEEKTWYFAKQGKSYGPFTEHELCNLHGEGKFGSNDYVFCKGEMEGWVRAETVPGLCDSLELSPEPEPEHHSVPFYEKAGLEHAMGKEKVEKQRDKREKAYWSKLRRRKK
jgi:hypothetical protein